MFLENFPMTIFLQLFSIKISAQHVSIFTFSHPGPTYTHLQPFVIKTSDSKVIFSSVKFSESVVI